MEVGSGGLYDRPYVLKSVNICVRVRSRFIIAFKFKLGLAKSFSLNLLQILFYPHFCTVF